MSAGRRGPASSYVPTHAPMGSGLSGWTRACGKCNAMHTSKEGCKKHRLWGFVCDACAVKLGLKK